MNEDHNSAPEVEGMEGNANANANAGDTRYIEHIEDSDRVLPAVVATHRTGVPLSRG